MAVICGVRSGMAPESGGRGGPGCPSSGLALPPQDPMDDRTALPTPWPLSDSAYKSLWPLAVVLALGSLRKVPGGEGPRVLGPGMLQVGPPVSSEATSILGLGCRSRASGLSGLIFCGGGPSHFGMLVVRRGAPPCGPSTGLGSPCGHSTGPPRLCTPKTGSAGQMLLCCLLQRMSACKGSRSGRCQVDQAGTDHLGTSHPGRL